MRARPAADGIRSLYATYAGNPAENYERYFVPDIGEPFAKRIVAAATLRQGERVLDVACGTGVAARLAAEATGSPGLIAGIDLNPAMVDVARATGAQGSEIAWHEGAAENLPFDDESFDVVVSSLGFQFFTDKVAAIREMRRVLTPGGRISIGTTGPMPALFQVIDAVIGTHLGPEASRFIETVFSFHDPVGMESMLGEAGFIDADVEFGPIPLRLAPPADFVWQYVNSTPLAALAAHMDEAERVALEQEVSQRCEPFTDHGSLIMEPQALVATARRK
jgi:ubiquinone/menaquinone biosynthesis C-methylase UbiE